MTNQNLPCSLEIGGSRNQGYSSLLPVFTWESGNILMRRQFTTILLAFSAIASVLFLSNDTADSLSPRRKAK